MMSGWPPLRYRQKPCTYGLCRGCRGAHPQVLPAGWSSPPEQLLLLHSWSPCQSLSTQLRWTPRGAIQSFSPLGGPLSQSPRILGMILAYC